MSDRRGLPLLSGPPPTNLTSTRADIGYRKCSKEFNVLFSRSRKCSHCGYSYCHSCSDFQALMPRGGSESGYDPANVCGYCIEFLNITAMGRGLLKTLPLAKLKRYVAAYNIKIDRAVEKEDLIDAMIVARGRNGCLSPENENYYRTYSVPDRTDYSRPRGLFSRSDNNVPPPIPPRPPNQPPTQEFARPDLSPDDIPPQQQRYAPPPGPPPRPPPRPQTNQRPPSNYPGAQYHTPSYHSQSPAPHPPPRPAYNSYPHQQAAPRAPAPNARPPPAPRATRPQQPPPQQGPYQRPAASRSSHNLNANNNTNTRTAPRPRSSSGVPPPAAPPPPPPTLDELLSMTPDNVRSLSIGTLKAILFSNHVNAGMILEKGELVKKVTDLIDDEKRERERQRIAEELEEQERIALQHAMMEEHQRQQREREEAAARAEHAHQHQDGAERGASEEGSSEVAGTSGSPPAHSSSPSTSPPRAPPSMASLERSGLCVVCQDEEANIAIVDCGHLAMCRGCSDLIMASSRECPLCRTRIVTEARLLRIFKT